VGLLELGVEGPDIREQFESELTRSGSRPRSPRRRPWSMLAKRNTHIGNHRTRVVCRLHAALNELAAGGIAKELNASHPR
jgi:hypothetical protein